VLDSVPTKPAAAAMTAASTKTSNLAVVVNVPSAHHVHRYAPLAVLGRRVQPGRRPVVCTRPTAFGDLCPPRGVLLVARDDHARRVRAPCVEDPRAHVRDARGVVR
jgi:hypothetical protein